MTSQINVRVLPVGEFDTPEVRAEFDAILGVIKNLGCEALVSEAVSDEPGAQRFAQNTLDPPPDLLIIVALRGLSAQIIEAAARNCPAPCLLWPVQGRFALPSSALAAGALRDAHLPVELLFGPPDHPRATERAGCVARAAAAYSRLRHSRIGVVGGLFPNLVACRYDAQTLQSRLGVTLVPIAYEDLRAGMQRAPSGPDDPKFAPAAITSNYAVTPADVPALAAGLKLHWALKQTAEALQLDAFATECWTGLPRELGLNPCLGFVEDAYTLACEGDVVLCAALLMVRYLTGVRAYVGDLYDLDLDGRLTLVHCGGPASLAVSPQAVVLGTSRLAHQRGFETLTCRPNLPAGPVTLMRLYGQVYDQMHLAMGELTDCEQAPNLSVDVKLARDRWNFLSQCFGNHYIVAPGDIRPELNLLAHWLGIGIVET